ncbi:hypothetical protein M595_5441 [Lyngbya aestuarii BL J]|uniref:Uncharacterized protein n=1 Tax=Lyngbya aestuarii BL J TaxID=1348334 RepID=U7Q9V6_9CYAN|nr:hypothetical protein M595_5441 [Lyngbya aestuarii BL J]
MLFKFEKLKTLTPVKFKLIIISTQPFFYLPEELLEHEKQFSGIKILTFFPK